MNGGDERPAYIGAMPDTPLPAPLTDEEIETRLLAAAVQEALDDPRPSIPHEVVRAWMLEKIAEWQREVDATLAE